MARRTLDSCIFAAHVCRLLSVDKRGSSSRKHFIIVSISQDLITMTIRLNRSVHLLLTLEVGVCRLPILIHALVHKLHTFDNLVRSCGPSVGAPWLVVSRQSQLHPRLRLQQTNLINRQTSNAHTECIISNLHLQFCG